MTHTTFYRKYRSSDFAELVGQNHVIQTLSNAIAHDRLSHAYIFSGPRGTGKTSSARILAKSLNCRTCKTTSPCGVCDLCRKITAGQSVDVIEIDAASNTGVDNIRGLNEQVGFAPVECRYRMFIIDEAHMLSSGAFNALLKTLEEPPSHVVFVLATTEPHKIPATIHSRCQHLQFRKLTMDEISGQLRHIATEENISISDVGLRVLARNASGCMRDAISLFDQVFSFKGSQIEDADIQSMLGAAGVDTLVSLLKSVFQSNYPSVVQSVVQLAESGVHPVQLIEDTIDLLKELLFFHYGYTDHLDGGRKDTMVQLAALASADRVQWVLESLSRTLPELRNFPDPQLLTQIRFLSVTKGPMPPSVSPVTKAAEVPSPSKDPASDHMRRLNEIRDVAMARPPLAPPPAAPAPALPKPQPRAPEVSTSNTGTPAQQWQQVMHLVKTEKQALFSVLNQSQLDSTDSQSLVIRLKQDFQFFREKIKEPKSQELLQPIIERVFGRRYAIRFAGDSSEPQTPSPGAISTDITPIARRAEQRSSDTGVKKINHIIALFEGAIVEN